MNYIFQFISDEDQESSVISFSAGTILGETSLLYPTESLANVKCATICELHTLSISDLARALIDYPDVYNDMRNIIEFRVDFSRELLSIKEGSALEVDTETVGNEDNSILWMKSRWKQLYYIKVIRVYFCMQYYL